MRQLTREYYELSFPNRPFRPGESPVPVSGKVFDDCDLVAVVESGLDFWLTSGRFAELFERKLAKFIGVRDARLVNSGSSANLVAVSALTSPALGEQRLRPGDEVITVAAGFPTTVNPILQNRLVPVFVDVELPTYNVDVSQLEQALSPRTRAMIFAHTLGNPFNAAAVSDFARKHGLWLIEDCCDALGATFGGRSVGTFGDLATFSFSLHITSPWAKEDVLRPVNRNSPSWWSRSAIGAATAGAHPAKTTPVASASTGNWDRCLMDMITSTLTRTSAIT
jgi:CDP-6-deoxy-D-xylo-4-hexulose-3-dehydrase